MTISELTDNRRIEIKFDQDVFFNVNALEPERRRRNLQLQDYGEGIEDFFGTLSKLNSTNQGAQLF